ncbi:MAG: VOC family protein [Chloroflexi bacterium]|nr:VOC family protein [Chloroflexota bacterium]
MLSKASVSAVIPVTDLDRAREFYEDLLDLTVYREELEQGTVVYDCNGTMLIVYQRATASSGEHTVAGFQVDEGFDEVIDRMLDYGITFDTFEIPGVPLDWDERGVLWDGERGTAWFKDPDGNVLAIGTGM